MMWGIVRYVGMAAGCRTFLVALMIQAFLAVLILLFQASQTSAADIQPSKEKLCAFRLEGVIDSGDHDRLAELVNRSHLDDLDARTRTICLRSPGGSYTEGLKISDLLYSRGILTTVTDGSECLSACALIFMSGVLPNREIPYRKLSAGGILGFHAPYISVAEGTYSKQQVENAVQATRVAILALLRLSSKRTSLSATDFLKKSLIAEVLAKGPEEAFFVQTVSEAARWDIEIYDASEQLPKPNRLDEVKNLCINFHYANMDERAPDGLNLSLKVEQYSSRFNKEDYRILVRDGRTNDTLCEVYPRTTRGKQDVNFFACSHDYWSDKSFGDCREYKTAALFGKFVPSFFTLAPSTRLKRFR